MKIDEMIELATELTMINKEFEEKSKKLLVSIAKKRGIENPEVFAREFDKNLKSINKEIGKYVKDQGLKSWKNDNISVSITNRTYYSIPDKEDEAIKLLVDCGKINKTQSDVIKVTVR